MDDQKSECCPDCFKVNAIDTSDSAKKADCITKTAEIEKKTPEHHKYVTTSRFNKLTKYNFAKRSKQKIASKNNIAHFIKKVFL